MHAHMDEYNCNLFSLQYTVILYEYTRFYLSSVQLMEIGNVFSFFRYVVCQEHSHVYLCVLVQSLEGTILGMSRI